MKRELKFRVWNGEIYYYSCTCFSFKGSESSEVIRNAGFFCFAKWLEQGGKSCHIQQYTGLKDKNGREIFEGDIIESEIRRCSERGEFEDYVECRIIKVQFKNGYFCDQDGKPLLNYKDDMWKVNKYSVIGNIFENPDLLK
jgi:uncharacterized phage protein (TIGR01671 family)